MKLLLHKLDEFMSSTDAPIELPPIGSSRGTPIIFFKKYMYKNIRCNTLVVG
jgi:hypothetical protein